MIRMISAQSTISLTIVVGNRTGQWCDTSHHPAAETTTHMLMLDAVKSRSPGETGGAGSNSMALGVQRRTQCQSVPENAKSATFVVRKKAKHSAAVSFCSHSLIMIAPACLIELVLSAGTVVSAGDPACCLMPSCLLSPTTCPRRTCDRSTSEFLLVCETGRTSGLEPVRERVAITSWISESTTFPGGTVARFAFKTPLLAKTDENARLHPDRSRRAV